MVKAFATLAVIAVAGMAALLLALLAEHSIPIALPTPTGQFSVGRGIYDWVDETTPDNSSPVPGAKRELLVWIWYPADAGERVTAEDYLPTPMRTAIEQGRGVLVSKFLTRDLANVRAHSLRDPKVAAQPQSYPVVLFRAGASQEVANYTALTEDLASHGYVVVGFDAPYRTFAVAFPDGRVVKRIPQNNPELCAQNSGAEQDECAAPLLNAWTRDASFVLDRLQVMNAAGGSSKFVGRLDMMKVGIFGHSFGGAVAAQFCQQDSRCKAGIDVDGALHGSVIHTGVERPFLILLSDHSKESGAETRPIKRDLQSFYDRLPVESRLYLAIRGANHFTFSDDGALLKSHFVRGIFRAFGMLGMDGDRQIAVTVYCVRTFFDRYLKGEASSALAFPSAVYPEIERLE
jgi:predicted dienelactone hydrolase